MKRLFPLALLAALVAPNTVFAQWLFGGGMAGAIADSIQLGEGEHCVAASAKIGDVIPLTPSYVGLVKSVSGPSSRCYESSQVRANMDVRLSESIRTSEQTICVPLGKAKGDRLKIVGLGEMEIKRITSSSDCSADAKTPIQAVAMSTQAPPPASSTPPIGNSPAVPLVVKDAPVSPKEAPIAPSKEMPISVKEAPIAAKTMSKEEAPSPTAQKLRELHGMLKDGLITQADYDAKKKELLNAF